MISLDELVTMISLDELVRGMSKGGSCGWSGVGMMLFGRRVLSLGR